LSKPDSYEFTQQIGPRASDFDALSSLASDQAFLSRFAATVAGSVAASLFPATREGQKQRRLPPLCAAFARSTPLEGAKKATTPNKPPTMAKPGLHHVAAHVGQLPLGEERAIV
jgi:hypothetical protein